MEANGIKIGVIDYGAGNLSSLLNALSMLGEKAGVVAEPSEAEACEKLILPGVGSFVPAMKRLEKSGFADFLPKAVKTKPFLGICLGMQLMLERGTEGGEYPGLGLIPGVVRLIRAPGLLIPHMGWNDLTVRKESPLSIKNGDYVYFVHSYMADCPEEYILATAEYGERVTAAVRGEGQVYGAQFHPEKSSDVGIGILKSFCSL